MSKLQKNTGKTKQIKRTNKITTSIQGKLKWMTYGTKHRYINDVSSLWWLHSCCNQGGKKESLFHFTAFFLVQHMWQIKLSNLDTTSKRLEREGLVFAQQPQLPTGAGSLRCAFATVRIIKNPGSDLSPSDSLVLVLPQTHNKHTTSICPSTKLP